MFIASATCLQRLTKLWKAVETIRQYAAERVYTIINQTDDKSHKPFAAAHPSNPMLPVQKGRPATERKLRNTCNKFNLNNSLPPHPGKHLLPEVNVLTADKAVQVLLEPIRLY